MSDNFLNLTPLVPSLKLVTVNQKVDFKPVAKKMTTTSNKHKQKFTHNEKEALKNITKDNSDICSWQSNDHETDDYFSCRFED